MSESTRARLQALYDEIPSFECIPGCTDCCGPTPWAPSEREPVEPAATIRGGAFERTSTGTLLFSQSADACLTCPFANNGCDIHSHRPFMCRLFGAADDPKLRCPHGCGPEKPLSAKQAAELTRQYQAIIDEEEREEAKAR